MLPGQRKKLSLFITIVFILSIMLPGIAAATQVNILGGVTLSNQTTGAPSNYSVSFQTYGGLDGLTTAQAVYIDFDPIVIPPLLNASYSVNGAAYSGNFSRVGVNTLMIGQGIPAGATVNALVYGVTNPAPGAAYNLRVYTDADNQPRPTPNFTINAGGGLQVAGGISDGAVVMAPGNTAVSNDNKWVLDITNGTVSNAVYAGNLIVNNLPPGLTFTAQKGAGNQIEITVAGTASPPLAAATGVGIVVKGSAVTEPGATDSQGIGPFMLNPSGAGGGSGGGGGGGLPAPVWRYDTPAVPANPQGYHPFDYNPPNLTLYWEPVMNGAAQITKYRIYRAVDVVLVDWNNEANWTQVLETTAPGTFTNPSNGKTFFTCSDASLLQGTAQGTQYRYGIRAVSADGAMTSGISNIPYPFQYGAASTLGISSFMLDQDKFTPGKFALGVMFSGPVGDPSDLNNPIFNLANYNVSVDTGAGPAPLTLKGPGTPGRAGFDPTRSAVVMDTSLSVPPAGQQLSGTLFITVNNIPGIAVNTFSDSIINHIAGTATGGTNQQAMGCINPIDPIGGHNTEYFFNIRASQAIANGGTIEITFPAEYTVGAVTIPDTSSRPYSPNSNINGGGATFGQLSGGFYNGISQDPSTKKVTLTLSGSVANGDMLGFVLGNIINPEPAVAPGQAYQFSVKAPTAATAVTMPAYVQKAGSGSITVNLKQEGTQTLIASQAIVSIGGPGMPPEGVNCTSSTGVFMFNGLQPNMGYHVWINTPPNGFFTPFPDMPVWVNPAGPNEYNFYMTNLGTAADIKTVTVTVNNLPADASKKAVAFAGSPNYYNETSSPDSVNGTTRVYSLKVKVPGEYMIGVYPYMPPATTGMNAAAMAPEFMPPPPQSYRITDDTPVTINLPSAAAMASVVVELKDDAGNVPSSAAVFAYSPTNPEVMGSGGLVDETSGQITLKLKRGVSYVIGGNAPGMPPVPEKKVFVDPNGNVFVDGQQVNKVVLTAKKPAKKISGTISYSDGSAVSGAPVYAKQVNGPGMTPPAFTSSSGSYTLWVPAGHWMVGTFIPDIGLRVVTEDADTTSNDAVANLTLQSITSMVATVTGWVKDSGNNAVQGAMIWAEDANGFLNATVTDPSGNYSLKIDSNRAAGARIHCASPEFGELPSEPYAATVNFTVSTSELTINFGRNVNGYVSVFMPGTAGAPGFNNGAQVNGTNSVTLKAPAGAGYKVECFLDDIGRIAQDNVTVPGTLDLSAEAAAANTVALNVTVNNGGDDTWIQILAIGLGKNFAAKGQTSGGVKSFQVPINSELSIVAHKDGYFPVKTDVTVGNADTPVTIDLVAENTGSSVTVNLTGSGTTAGNSEYYVWAKNAAANAVVKAVFPSTTGNINLPAAGTWVFRASTEGYVSSEQSVSIPGATTVSIDLNTAVAAIVNTALVKPSQGGTVSGDAGAKMIIPANALGSENTDASIKISNTAAVMETPTAKPMGAATDIVITDSQGNPVTNLNSPIEIVLNYHSDYLTWVNSYGQGIADQMALNMQLAYFDAAVGDWVSIPATNDTSTHIIRGQTTHLTKFAVVYPESLVLKGTYTPHSSPLPVASATTGNSAATGKETTTAAAPVNTRVTATIGGTLSTADKAVTVAIPANALSSDGKVSITEVIGTNIPALESSLTLGSKVFNITVEGASVSKPVTLTLSFDPAKFKDVPAEKIGLYYFNESRGGWIYAGGEADTATGKLNAEVGHFTKFAVMANPGLPVLNDIGSHWAKKDIKRLVGMGAVSGYSDSTFKPDNSITRAEFATILAKAMGWSEDAGAAKFSDDLPDWAKGYVGAAVAKDVIKGYAEDNTFRGSQLINRSEIAVMMVRALGKEPSTDTLTFSDASGVPNWAAGYVSTAVKEGIVKGMTGNVFAPVNNATRAESSTMINRLLNSLGI